MTDPNDSLKRYLREQERLLDDLAGVSRGELVQDIAARIMSVPDIQSFSAADQADIAHTMALSFCRRVKGLPHAECEELAGLVRTRVEFEVWSRQRKEPGT